MTEPTTCTIIIPCYNEEHRLDAASFRGFAASNLDVSFLFVDDGSRDNTLGMLRELVETNPSRLSLLHLRENRGKAEAVRNGLLAATQTRPTYVGFWDADLATPLSTIRGFKELLDSRSDIEMVFGARVHLLGRSVRRRLARHYAGRVFATVAAFALGVGVYDTQCGAKMFRVSSGLVDRLTEPFIGGWIFDVEMIAREIRARRNTTMPRADQIIYEYPLTEWQDVAGSKIKLTDWFVIGGRLARIYFKYLR
jgi:glycosyltransferase involved in cell wall biosynthesis